MTITIRGVDHAIRTVSRLEDVKDRIMEVAYRLCEIGVPVAQSVFHAHATITATRTRRGAKVEVVGTDSPSAVLFIEFGAGDDTGTNAENYDAVPDVVRRGSWSETHKRQYADHSVWYWGRPGYAVKFPPHHVYPHSGTYLAYKAMVEALPQVVKEVFSR